MADIDIDLSIKLQQQLFVDPRRIRLLHEIEKCGSISQAAKQVRISYKTAWDNLNTMDLISPRPLLQRSTGGKEGGGTTLTAYAKRVLQLYQLLEQTQQRAFVILQDENIPLTSLLSATAKFSLQSSARNQLIGRVQQLCIQGLNCQVQIAVEGLDSPISASITQTSAERLQLQAEQELLLMFKAPWVSLHQHAQKTNSFKGQIRALQQQQDSHEAIIQLSPQIEFCASYHSADQHQIGDSIYVSIDPEKIILLAL
ncbi:LysR family transcriptional regulator [Testudinibacter sp. TR-2022]|uniref:TOBE domain-containing protein n=1 Tax=Testudinibacter sp. TR-2022 TaxID=2585029 RepID=UPI00111A27FB|nr:TOBE domain-containing protein [Testudinibacter sp. TR-2022]TNH05461.1 LysR family transcriptional regulator [Pasteurellaceae bacterium Phil31]TNH07164.1 LysR family transcriptional regulator [Testudinibacter sp. TR-2022]TNH11138.1 LysR family transcriptional regulator [Testudinibacter sp. TR-2022]TNH13359.1 LysR family transcriptional regulator [Testudinibacter sp. TR-2022]TNH16324.1 LysR family transcriptional regulator [Testudinibacter sp. TR-2022]